MKKARFLLWFALMRCVSSLTKPSVTQFCHFTTSSHVSLYTEKKNKSSTIPYSAQTEGKTLRAPIIRAAHHRVRPYAKVSC